MEQREAAQGQRDGHGEPGTYSVPFAVVGLDRELRVTKWSGRAERLLGHAPADALGRSIVELIPVAGGEASWRTLLIDGDVPPVWMPLVDGRTLEWSPAAVHDGDGRFCGVVCYGRDATARVEERRDAELEHVMLRVILDNLNIVLCAYARDGEYMFVEGKGLETVGLKPGQLVGQNPFELFGNNSTAVEFVRRGLDGIATPALTIKEFDRYFLSWHIPAPLGGRAALVSVSLDVSESKFREEELLEKIDLIERQQQVIRELATPIIEVWEGVLVMPIIGVVNSVRTAEIMDTLLQSVSGMRARFAILDMTGIEAIDTATANHLLGMIRAIRLLGAEGIITGIHPGIAQTIVTLGVELRDIIVHATLRQALKYCIADGRAGAK